MLTAIVLQEKDVFKVARFSILVRSRFALRDGSFEIELAHTPSCMFERGINLSSIILEYFLFYFFLFSSSDCMQWMSVRRTPSGPSEVSA